MTYIYAYSNHKYGLSRLRRMAVLYRELQEQGVEVEMLTNDFRAAAVIREYGVPACTTIETVWDIDFVAQRGDSLIMDTPEDDEGKLAQYVEMFSEVSKVANTCDEMSRFGEKILFVDPMVDVYYRQCKEEPKIKRTVFFYGDSDPKKWIKTQLDRFANSQMELLLGEYFYLGYEAEIAPSFFAVHESDAYREIIAHSSRIITCSAQTAYEARAAGASVTYLCDTLAPCHRERMEEWEIKVVDNLLQKIV